MPSRGVPPPFAPLERPCHGPGVSTTNASVRVWSVAHLETPQEAMPDGCVDVVLSLAPEPSALVVGTLEHATTIDRFTGHALVGLSLRPGLAAAFLGCPASELTGRTASLTDLLGRSAATALIDRVLRTEGFAERARMLQAFVDVRITGARAATWLQPRVQAAVDAIRRSAGRASVAAVARDQQCTPRVLQRAFQQHVGVSPKQYARIVRFHAALRALRTGRRMIEVAFDLGYADQAHFVRDFRALAGRTPSTFSLGEERTHLFNTDVVP